MKHSKPLLSELMDEAEQQFDKDSHEKQKKMEKDRKQAEEIRVKAMETFGESKKRVSEGNEPKQRRKRATGMKHCNIYSKSLKMSLS